MADAPLCFRCGKLPKEAPSHHCSRCLELRLPMDEQVVLSYRRREDAVVLGLDKQRIPRPLWPEGERWCSGCFSFRRFDIGRTKLEVRVTDSKCRPCLLVTHRLRTYGLTPEMDEKLGTRCNICNCVQGRQALAIDHDHKTGRVRGKLCDRHNHLLLGAGNDCLEIFQAAVEYLTHPPAQQWD